MVKVGKAIGDSIYVHLSACELLSSPDHRVFIAEELTLIPETALARVNVAKVNVRAGRTSLLEYSDFDTDPFPVLKGCWSA